MKFIRGFKYAGKGLWLVISTQLNMRVHLLIVLMVVLSGSYFKITNTEWLIILLIIAMVLSAEAINTAIEKMVDLQSPEHNPKAGDIKDIAASAVLLMAIISVIVGFIIFKPYLLELIF
jgi:diacylglycerol kinase (ATP)